MTGTTEVRGQRSKDSSAHDCGAGLWAFARLNWPMLTAIGAGLVLAASAVAASQFVTQREYQKDQNRIEKRLDEIGADVKALLQR